MSKKPCQTQAIRAGKDSFPHCTSQTSSSRGAKRLGDLKRAVRNPFLTAAFSGRKGFLPALHAECARQMSTSAEIATLPAVARNDGFFNLLEEEKE